MPIFVSLFDYDLPEELIAQKPVEPRDHSRLMVLDRASGRLEHRKFFEIVEYLRPGDVLVFNNTKVFKARLQGQVESRKWKVEIFLLRERDGAWEVMVRPGRKVHIGDVIDVGAIHESPKAPRAIRELPLRGTVVQKHIDGTVMIDFGISPDEVLAFCEAHGEVPIPPYVQKSKEALENYQTVYAKEVGAVAAPTAGFHFTERLLDELRAKGVQMEFVTLHVGLGTFRPVKTATLEEHQMHAESVSIDEDTAERINQAKAEGRRIIAVGTTVVRALEAVASITQLPNYPITTFTGDVNIFIIPGYQFKIVDGLITNFHLPKSTLLALVSAFASRHQESGTLSLGVLEAYEEAKQMGYRFYSFGDAMFIR